MIRWLITLTLVAAAAFIIWSAFDAWQTCAGLQAQVESEQGRFADLQARQRQLMEQKARIGEWNSLQARVQAAGISSDQWVTNDIHTKTDISWPELERLLDFLSRSTPQTTGVWFNPESFSVSRAEMGKAAGSIQADSGKKPGDRGKYHTLYTVRVDGEFLIPKTGTRP